MPEVEAMVTEQLLTTFTFRAFQVDSLEERLSLERDLIATLSATPEMTPEWLGQYAFSLRIRESGLWNSDHVGAQERADLNRLELDRSDGSVEIGDDPRLQIVDCGVDFQLSFINKIGKERAGGIQPGGRPHGAFHRSVVDVVTRVVPTASADGKIGSIIGPIAPG